VIHTSIQEGTAKMMVIDDVVVPAWPPHRRKQVLIHKLLSFDFAHGVPELALFFDFSITDGDLSRPEVT
jgi:hypothetical protein